MHTPTRLCLLSLLVALAASAATFTPTPYGWFLEAESALPKSSTSIQSDPTASSGTYLTSSKPWEPLLRLPALPADLPPSFELRTLRRASPLCIKTFNPDASQRELAWSWSRPKRWSWVTDGTFRASDLQHGLLLIRDGASTPADLDAIALVTNAALANAVLQLPPIPVKLTLDWTSTDTHPITPLHWSINDYELTRSPLPAPAFDSLITPLTNGLIRIHHAALADRWSDPTTRRWNPEKIRAAITSIPAYKTAPILLSIPSWPSWMYSGDALPAESYDEFSALCIDLVRILRTDLGCSLTHLELLNEKEHNYLNVKNLPELWRLLARLFQDLHAAYPDLRLGGPALTWPNPEWVTPFLSTCGPHIHFLSWHNYATGSRDTPTDTILTEKVDAIASMAETAIDLTRKLSPDHPLETFLTEYNISWTWETRDPRMTTSIGALFDARVVKAVAQKGITGAFVWHLKDNIYGLADGKNTARPAWHLFRLAQQHLLGDLLPSTSSHPDLFDALPIRHADGSRALLLLNLSDAPLALPPTATLLPQPRSPLNGFDLHDTATPIHNLDTPLPPYTLRLLTESP